MELLLGILLGVFVLVLLVVVHELGHAIAARRNGVVVEEFGIGFPPRAWAKKLKSGIVFTVNWLPLGGFVKLQGENDSATKKGDYGAATFWQKTKILYAGVFVNWAVAALLLTVLALTGLPKIVPNQFSLPADSTITMSPVRIASLVEAYPAATAGLQAGDEIVSIAGEPIGSVDELVEVSVANRGEAVSVVYNRDGEELEVSVALRDSDRGVFGATLGQQETLRATWSAPLVGIVTTGQFTWVTLQGLGQLVADFFGGLFLQLSPDEATREAAGESLDRAANSVAGPVGILGVIFPAAGQAGLTEVVFLAAIVSLTLAVMNALPIPALDGGRWFVTALFKLLRKPLSKEREEKIHGTGFLALMALIVLVTIADVTKLFS
jgi:regulator of sigma E protease